MFGLASAVSRANNWSSTPPGTQIVGLLARAYELAQGGARGRRCMPCGKRKRCNIVKRDKHLVTHIVYSANHRSYTTTTSACLL